ncbi:DUF3343 domain-containing protein [Intestinimonas butyriciproducens]|uniref:DUF3343 domain-containing protein n=1 Tax=Intestinimonas butyriciproducens TaxID=1297617 RepID=UPI0018AC567B|nr:DUF3343 domain-containing protein [Intestinimonas butyriciproducens]MDB7817836.1 DUF3343 domain-containing protein [Intestinimonas butyriciproducens]MDB7844727.1 DUF3343 domain-containing protein [Intestinimonas butyriciproducens]MDB7859091.1 DUF3343 domain-containing protein [Intestinimonas butyriciproducens]
MLYLMTFSSHFDAIFANRTLKSAGLDVCLMPVPRAVSASCGTCVCFPMKEGARPPEALWRRLVWERLYSQCDGVWTELARGPSRGGPC